MLEAHASTSPTKMVVSRGERESRLGAASQMSDHIRKRNSITWVRILSESTKKKKPWTTKLNKPMSNASPKNRNEHGGRTSTAACIHCKEEKI
jgi:hypothetical protein